MRLARPHGRMKSGMQIAADVRYALRQFAKAPGFTTTAILTLALGIGATTAIFTLVYAVLLKSLPVVNPEDLWRVGDEENCCVTGGMQDNWTLFSYELYKQFRHRTTGFAELAAFQAGQTMIGVRRNGSNKPSEPYQSEFVSGNYFLDLSAIPGVKQVSFSMYSPMEGDNWGEGVFIEGEPQQQPGEHDHGASWVRASPVILRP